MTRFLLATAALFLAVPIQAQDVLELGASIPLADQAFSTTDGATLSLSGASRSAGLAVIFWSDACPWVDKYADRMAALADSYSRAGVGFVFVQSEPLAEESGANPGAPVMLDVEGQLAQAFGARNAPQAFFFGSESGLAYQGAIDDSPANVDRVQVPYLQQAMDQSIAGVPIEVQSTRALGCTIKTAAR
ncbi:MAG: thioredoxin family protein [Rubricoccaceae bacterium]